MNTFKFSRFLIIGTFFIASSINSMELISQKLSRVVPTFLSDTHVKIGTVIAGSTVLAVGAGAAFYCDDYKAGAAIATTSPIAAYGVYNYLNNKTSQAYSKRIQDFYNKIHSESIVLKDDEKVDRFIEQAAEISQTKELYAEFRFWISEQYQKEGFDSDEVAKKCLFSLKNKIENIQKELYSLSKEAKQEFAKIKTEIDYEESLKNDVKKIKKILALLLMPDISKQAKLAMIIENQKSLKVLKEANKKWDRIAMIIAPVFTTVFMAFFQIFLKKIGWELVE